MWETHWFPIAADEELIRKAEWPEEGFDANFPACILNRHPKPAALGLGMMVPPAVQMAFGA